MIKLGDRVRDVYSKFTGIATSRVEYLYGCARICITPEKLTKDGKPEEGCYFDEQQVEVVKVMKKKISKHNSATAGGPYPDPKRF